MYGDPSSYPPARAARTLPSSPSKARKALESMFSKPSIQSVRTIIVTSYSTYATRFLESQLRKDAAVQLDKRGVLDSNSKCHLP